MLYNDVSFQFYISIRDSVCVGFWCKRRMGDPIKRVVVFEMSCCTDTDHVEHSVATDNCDDENNGQ